MPNIRGGKGYKSGKGKSKFADSEQVEFITRQPDQMVGRLVRLLGDLNAQIYCDDNKQRVCKICRSIKKTVRFEVGDVVLVSLRDCEVPKAELANGVRGDRGDILDKYHPYQYSELKKEGINPYIFGNIDTVSEISKLVGEGKEAAAEKVAEAAAQAEDDDIFDRDEEQEEEEDEENLSETEREKRKREGVVVDKKNKVSHRAKATAQKEKELTLDDL
uniref:S1-like domain-containing protein n=1 Tax=viral metagenome TaxID=1070528 RepID=A0A6C0AMH3_9ZZZZ